MQQNNERGIIMGFIDVIKAKAKADKKTIVLPESMDRRTWVAAEKILKEGLANLIIIGTPEDIGEHSNGHGRCPAQPSSTHRHMRKLRSI